MKNTTEINPEVISIGREPKLQPTIPKRIGMVDKNTFDFYRCGKCNGLITKPEMSDALDRSGKPCRCGALKFSPTNPLWWEYFLPRVWVFAWMRVKGVA
jgi:hypothetical protein